MRLPKYNEWAKSDEEDTTRARMELAKGVSIDQIEPWGRHTCAPQVILNCHFPRTPGGHGRHSFPELLGPQH